MEEYGGVFPKLNWSAPKVTHISRGGLRLMDSAGRRLDIEPWSAAAVYRFVRRIHVPQSLGLCGIGLGTGRGGDGDGTEEMVRRGSREGDEGFCEGGRGCR